MTPDRAHGGQSRCRSHLLANSRSISARDNPSAFRQQVADTAGKTDRRLDQPTNAEKPRLEMGSPTQPEPWKRLTPCVLPWPWFCAIAASASDIWTAARLYADLADGPSGTNATRDTHYRGL